jgi:hypothetical protein
MASIACDESSERGRNTASTKYNAYAGSAKKGKGISLSMPFNYNNGKEVIDSQSNVKRGQSQEDAMEFMTYLLDALHESILEAKAKSACSGDSNAIEMECVALISSLNSHSQSDSDSLHLIQDILSVPSVSSMDSSIDESGDDDDGWEVVGAGVLGNNSRAKSKLKTIIDTESRRNTQESCSSTSISRLFHGSVR